MVTPDPGPSLIDLATLIVGIGTVVALFVARWLERKGQKDGSEQNKLAHDLKEREFRWDQITETVTYQRDLINILKQDVEDAKGRVMRHVKYEQLLEQLAEEHRAWDNMAKESNPDLPDPPPLCPDELNDPYYGA